MVWVYALIGLVVGLIIGALQCVTVTAPSPTRCYQSRVRHEKRRT